MQAQLHNLQDILRNKNAKSLVQKAGKSAIKVTKTKSIFLSSLIFLLACHVCLLFNVILNKEQLKLFNIKHEFYCSSLYGTMPVLNANI